MERRKTSSRIDSQATFQSETILYSKKYAPGHVASNKENIQHQRRILNENPPQTTSIQKERKNELDMIIKTEYRGLQKRIKEDYKNGLNMIIKTDKR